jgi:hypothetical protein
MLLDTTMRFGWPGLSTGHLSAGKKQEGSYSRRPRSLICAALSCACAAATPFYANAQSTPQSVWQGEWQIEATTFTLRVSTQGNRFFIEPVRPLGLEWTTNNGIIDGNNGTIRVEYQGVSAQVMVQLISDTSAIVRSMSCQPDYHVICTLVRNQQALFIKLPSTANQSELPLN